MHMVVPEQCPLQQEVEPSEATFYCSCHLRIQVSHVPLYPNRIPARRNIRRILLSFTKMHMIYSTIAILVLPIPWKAENTTFKVLEYAANKHHTVCKVEI